MMQRIYGTAWFTKEELEENLKLREEAKERDHRKLGRNLTCSLMTQNLVRELLTGSQLEQQFVELLNVLSLTKR